MNSDHSSTEARKTPVNQPGEDRTFWDGQWVSMAASGIEPPDAPTWPNDRDKVLLNFIRPYLPLQGTVAELGCGSARLLARIGLERPNLKLIAVDYEAAAIKLVQVSARAYGVKIDTALDDVNQLKFADNAFDLVMSGGLLEHFVDPKPVLREMVRTLKPGGAFFAAIVPRKTFSLHRPLHRILGPQVYRTRYNADRYSQWLRELGMSDVVQLSKGFYPPLFHHLPAAPRRAIERSFRKFDGSWLADRLGYFFVVAARKPHQN